MSRRTLYAIATGVVALDQLIKMAAVMLIEAGQSVPVAGRYLSLTIQHNTGAAFGMFPAASAALIVLAIGIIILIIVYGVRLAGANRWLLWGIGLALGGAVGNLIDRVCLGYVIDFIDVHFWPVFNVADIAITCGAILIIITLLYSQKHHKSAQSRQ